MRLVLAATSEYRLVKESKQNGHIDIFLEQFMYVSENNTDVWLRVEFENYDIDDARTDVSIKVRHIVSMLRILTSHLNEDKK